MNVYVSRDSVAVGDDIDAPHGRTISLPDERQVDEVLSEILESGYLPKIAGGRATWSVVSNIPLAVVAQQWTEPRLLPLIVERSEELDRQQNGLRIHFNYHAQIDPEIVYEVFCGFRLTAH